MFILVTDFVKDIRKRNKMFGLVTLSIVFMISKTTAKYQGVSLQDDLPQVLEDPYLDLDYVPPRNFILSGAEYYYESRNVEYDVIKTAIDESDRCLEVLQNDDIYVSKGVFESLVYWDNFGEFIEWQYVKAMVINGTWDIERDEVPLCMFVPIRYRYFCEDNWFSWDFDKIPSQRQTNAVLDIIYDVCFDSYDSQNALDSLDEQLNDMGKNFDFGEIYNFFELLIIEAYDENIESKRENTNQEYFQWMCIDPAISKGFGERKVSDNIRSFAVDKGAKECAKPEFILYNTFSQSGSAPQRTRPPQNAPVRRRSSRTAPGT
uniref:uncharacterized protein LOC120342686 isoform X2 n=1 Tax=Styela clava TaxID=7725 RepID=UPI00193AC06B|nr:uncharacterized protein LOC120342686 isoform X2 [Styela clava]